MPAFIAVDEFVFGQGTGATKDLATRGARLLVAMTWCSGHLRSTLPGTWLT